MEKSLSLSRKIGSPHQSIIHLLTVSEGISGQQQFFQRKHQKGNMSGLELLDADVGVMAANPASVFGNIAMNGDEYVRCNRCGFGGCDVRVQGCGCTLHAVGN